VILPKANEKDLKDVPQEVREDMTFILVERIEEVLPAAFDHDSAAHKASAPEEPLPASA
jgi:ATP-dependent Lon protease